MNGSPMPWKNAVVSYCPKCRLTFPKETQKCERCGRHLVEQVRREKLDDR